MAQDRKERFTCDAGGKQFANRPDLEEHERECQAKQAQDQGKPMTRTAGGPPPEL